MAEITHLPIASLLSNEGQVAGLPTNPRQWTQTDINKIAKSLKDTPELFEMRPCLVYPQGGKFIVLGGNLRLEGARKNKDVQVPCIIVPEDTPVDKLKEIVIKDNGAFGAWDFDMLANEWDDLPLTEWGVPAWDTEVKDEESEEYSAEKIAQMQREFEERMAAGEISEEDEEYQEFLEKFKLKLKKTTDDCYTPESVYDAVAEFVASEYGVDKSKFVRPFYPGGDYKKEHYPKGCVVVDNPPFSILSEILRFYTSQNIQFFLFCDARSIFGSLKSAGSKACAICTGVAITYENGANVNTSFVTNMETDGSQSKTSPRFYALLKKANDENLRQLRRELPKYAYDHHIITSPFLGTLSRLGIDFAIPSNECEFISALDAQKESKRGIFGSGLIVSERVYAEREKAEREKPEREKEEREKAAYEKAEREKAEREKAEHWELSEREWEIVRNLSNKKQ